MRFKSDKQRRAVMAKLHNGSSGNRKGKCNPKRFICSVSQWFREKDRLSKLPRSRRLSEAKNIFSDDLERRIEVAENIKERKIKPYSYDDLIFLKDEIRVLEGEVAKHPGDSFTRRKLEKRKDKYKSILSIENTLFRKAVRKRNVVAVEKGIYRRLPENIVYSVSSDIPGVVRSYFQGLSVNEIHRKTNTPKAVTKRIISVIKAHE